MPTTYRQAIYSAAALGSAAGRTLALNNSMSWVQLDKVLVVYVASATVGNRVPTFRLLDSDANVLWQAAAGVNVTASQTGLFPLGVGLPAQSLASPLQQTVGLPANCGVPINGSLQVFDTANIDTADTASAAISYLM